MSDYAIKNFMDVENVAKEDGREMRFTRKYLDSTELGVSYEAFPPNFRSPSGHKHEVQEEAYVVVHGSGQIKLGEDVHEVKQWDVVRVAPSVVRGFNAGPDGLVLIAIGGTKPEGGDGHLVEDAWIAE